MVLTQNALNKTCRRRRRRPRPRPRPRRRPTHQKVIWASGCLRLQSCELLEDFVGLGVTSHPLEGLEGSFEGLEGSFWKLYNRLGQNG